MSNSQQPDRDHYPDPSNSYWRTGPDGRPWTASDLIDPDSEPYKAPGIGVAILLAIVCWVVLGFLVWGIVAAVSR